MGKHTPQIEKVGEILDQSLKRLELAGQLSDYGVWPIWNDKVGPTIARNAQPEKIRNGTLFVKVSSPIWMQQLHYMKDTIADKLNQELGREAVKNIFFFVGKVEAESVGEQTAEPASSPAPNPEMKLDDATLAEIKDPEVRRVLRRLFAAHSRRPKK
ncbi:MAG: hypothetical protein A3F90_01720 [Deltaproteobacteria bacterium RIFCSPLOWO2_12_FULL_60_19]|nr:MAG: hypothetical protein A3F90_01720 [Deltaproteobacteria bacterium RIFCSPLOWO2_12_FULL_60_19]